eukprot:3799544-Pyramimonas_sp.AAC.1
MNRSVLALCEHVNQCLCYVRVAQVTFDALLLLARAEYLSSNFKKAILLLKEANQIVQVYSLSPRVTGPPCYLSSNFKKAILLLQEAKLVVQ